MVKGSGKPVNEESIRQFFQWKVVESGYSLQTKVEQRLVKEQYHVTKESPYIDHDKAIGRRIDIIARKLIPQVSEKKDVIQFVSQLHLIIECKNLPDHGWIFFSAGQKPFFLPEFNSMMPIPAEGKSHTKESIPLAMFPKFFTANSFAEFIYDTGKEDKGNKKIKTNGRDDNLYEASMAVIKAARHYKHQTEKDGFPAIRKLYPKVPIIPFLMLYQSVIVFRGHMYRSDIVNDEPFLMPIKYAELQKNYVSGSYNETTGTIHVVSYEHLEEYLQILYEKYSRQQQYIMDNQENIKKEWQHYHPTSIY